MKLTMKLTNLIKKIPNANDSQSQIVCIPYPLGSSLFEMKRWECEDDNNERTPTPFSARDSPLITVLTLEDSLVVTNLEVVELFSVLT